jgi:hypothetical protein
MNETLDPVDSGTPKEAVLRDHAAELSYAVLGREDPEIVARCVKEFRHFWQRGYSAGIVRTARRLGTYR